MPDQPVAIVTGAGSGIGRATAVMLAQRGYAVALVGRREQPLRETERLIGGGLVLAADISDAAACQSVISRTESAFGRIDVLVNNAGSAPLQPIDKSTPAVIDETFGINALAPAYLIHFAWPVFVRQKRGCIVNVSSMGTVDPFPGFFAYAAAKSAVNLMALSCANEGKRLGIRAFSVAPGAVETAMLRENFPESRLPRNRTLAPEAVAEVIVACIAGERDAENGKTIVVKSP
jgi:NAD(P)-dependent dehydrogenase (short-subunit alcohol dehydrogenase family)